MGRRELGGAGGSPVDRLCGTGRRQPLERRPGRWPLCHARRGALACRAQLAAGRRTALDFRGDLLGDAVLEEFDAELRELVASWRLGSVDIKAGRQVLTWGTGDLLFLNDLFPKGWVSFFIGRDDEYLKAPSDALRLTWYNDRVNIDLAAMPLFNPDEYLTGERLSFFSPRRRRHRRTRPAAGGREPSASLSNTEWALQAVSAMCPATNWRCTATAAFTISPRRAGPGDELVFPRLDAWGASWRRPLGPGLFNAEFSSYHSVDDRSGTNPRHVPMTSIAFCWAMNGRRWRT